MDEVLAIREKYLPGENSTSMKKEKKIFELRSKELIEKKKNYI